MSGVLVSDVDRRLDVQGADTGMPRHVDDAIADLGAVSDNIGMLPHREQGKRHLTRH